MQSFHKAALALVLLAALAAGCGDSKGGGGGDEGDRNGGGGTGGSGPLPRGEGLEISSLLGLTIVPDPLPGESNVHGSIAVSRDGEPASEFTATLNGEALRTTAFGLGNPIEGERYPGIGAGQSLEIEVSEGEETERLSLPCPEGIEIQLPPEGALVEATREIDVSWSGNPYASRSIFKPMLSIKSVGDDGKLEMAAVGVQVPEKSNSTKIRVPAGAVGRETYILLNVPGPLVEVANAGGGSHDGTCHLELRRRIEVEAP